MKPLSRTTSRGKYLNHLKSDFLSMDFSIKKLDVSHMSQAHELHNHVFQHMVQNKQFFLFLKDEESIKHEIENHITVGVFDSNNKLIGKSTLMEPTSEEMYFQIKSSAKGVRQLASTCVHPLYQGRGLAKDMMEELSKYSENDILCTAPVFNNFKNLRNRLKYGFILLKMVRYPKMDVNLYGLVCIDKDALCNQGEKKFAHYSDMDKITNILNHGYIGIDLFDNGLIQFIKNAEVIDTFYV